MVKCVVLIATTPYSEAYQHLLRRLIDQKTDLFVVVGVDCEGWEDAMDWLCVDLVTSGAAPEAFCNTTSHPDETEQAVIEFAKLWNQLSGNLNEVEVMRV
jgi:hypothetical protein